MRLHQEGPFGMSSFFAVWDIVSHNASGETSVIELFQGPRLNVCPLWKGWIFFPHRRSHVRMCSFYHGLFI